MPRTRGTPMDIEQELIDDDDAEHETLVVEG